VGGIECDEERVRPPHTHMASSDEPSSVVTGLVKLGPFTRDLFFRALVFERAENAQGRWTVELTCLGCFTAVSTCEGFMFDEDRNKF